MKYEKKKRTREKVKNAGEKKKGGIDLRKKLLKVKQLFY